MKPGNPLTELMQRRIQKWKDQCIFGSVQEMAAAQILEEVEDIAKEIEGLTVLKGTFR